MVISYSLFLINQVILLSTKKLPDGYVSILDDPLKIEMDLSLSITNSKNDIVDYFKPYSKDIKIGKCFNDWWGINVSVLGQ